MNANEAYEHTRYLVDECGIRTPGSDQIKKAIAYIEGQFASWGLNVSKHDFTIPTPKLETSSLKVGVGNEWQEFEHKPVWFAGETPVGGVKGPVAYCGDGSPGYLERSAVPGAVLIIARDTYVEYPDVQITQELNKYQPAAVLFTVLDGHRGGLPDVFCNYKSVETNPAPPMAIVSYEDALNLVQRSEQEDLVAVYEAHYQVKERGCQNVIGTLQGTDPEAGAVIVCGHNDTTPGGPGATDDAAAIGVVMAVAKYYADATARGEGPKRTMHFIAWSGHESGLFGSRQFVQDNPALISDVKFVMNYDVVGMSLSPEVVFTTGNEAVVNQVHGTVEDLKFSHWTLYDAPIVLDTLNFNHLGIPTVSYLQYGLYYGNHTPADNMRLVSPAGFFGALTFTGKILDWAVSCDEIPQGYPAELHEACKQVGAQYGWGLFESN